MELKRGVHRRRRDSSAPRDQRSRAPFVVGAAALAGLVLARVIDWRSHAHPR